MGNLFDILNHHKKSIFYSLIIYVSLFLILLSTGISTAKIEEVQEFEIDLSVFEQIEEQENQENKINEDDLMSEDKLNVAVNEALKDNPLSNPYDYYDMPEQSDEYKEQLIKNALEDEYDDYANKEYKVDESYYADVNKPKDNKDKTDETKTNYQGATYVNYYLKDRHERNLKIPTYACEESGKVIVKIYVNRAGRVLKAELLKATNAEPCLVEAALNAARNSSFLRNNDSPEKQSGTISYTFKEQ